MSRNLLFLYFSMLLTFVIVFFLSPKNLLQIIIIFGQAHFLTSYFYRNKVGKLDGEYLKKFAVLFLIFGFFAIMVVKYIALFNYLLFFTIMIFVIHYFFDELKILNFTNEKYKNLSCLSVLFSFTSIFLGQTFEVSRIYIYPFILVSALFFFYFSYLFWTDTSVAKNNSTLSVYFFIFLNFSLPILFVFQEIDILKITGAIIIFHYIRWYLYYYERFEKVEDKKELSFYLDVILWIHVLVITMFIMYSLDSNRGALVFFFNPIFFYAWTILHILLSVRLDDYNFIKKIYA